MARRLLFLEILLFLAVVLLLFGCTEGSEVNAGNESTNNGSNFFDDGFSDDGASDEIILCSNSEYSTREGNENGAAGYEKFIELDFNSRNKLIEAVKEKGDSALQEISDLTCITYFNLEPYGNRLGETHPFSEITDISALSSLTNLRVLILINTDVSDITALENLTKLEKIDAIGSEISDLTPLRNLKNLQKINLNLTKVTDVSPLSGLENLKSVSLYATCFTDVTPFENMTNLKSLGLFYNYQIPVEECEALKAKLPDTNIECPTGRNPQMNKCTNLG
ncbi:MAG: hypothetical protein ABIA76_05500 [Candidatus Diapherotrites archaeon]